MVKASHAPWHVTAGLYEVVSEEPRHWHASNALGDKADALHVAGHCCLALVISPLAESLG
jgi:hypothetical protein